MVVASFWRRINADSILAVRSSQKAGGNARCRSAIRFVVLSNLRFGRICAFGDAPSFCVLLDDFPHSAIIPALANPTAYSFRVLVGPEIFAGTYQLQQRIVVNRIHPVGILRHRVVAVRMFYDVGLARSAAKIPPGPAASAGHLCGEGSATSLAPHQSTSQHWIFPERQRSRVGFQESGEEQSLVAVPQQLGKHIHSVTALGELESATVFWY